MSQSIHISVLANEVVELLQPQPGKKFIDATLGAAGHTTLLLQKGGIVLGLDQDQSVLDWVHTHRQHESLQTVQANFMTIRTQADKFGFTQCDGILFDLGVSSLQFDTPERGFSFQYEAPLDMRMNQKLDTSAKDLVNTMSEDELFELLVNNAQEPQARKIAHAIVANRPLETTTQLAEVISAAVGNKRDHIHPATRTFQALRIAVNQELKILRPALEEAIGLLKPNGRLCVISFHEGEDRIVKRTFETVTAARQARLLTKNPIIPTRDEIINNPRSRSAKLRCIEKI